MANNQDSVKINGNSGLFSPSSQLSPNRFAFSLSHWLQHLITRKFWNVIRLCRAKISASDLSVYLINHCNVLSPNRIEKGSLSSTKLNCVVNEGWEFSFTRHFDAFNTHTVRTVTRHVGLECAKKIPFREIQARQYGLSR